MISYEPLWETMRQKGVSQYALIHKYHISPGQITRLKRNESVSTHTIDMFCNLLDCRVENIMLHISEEEGNDTDDISFLSESSGKIESRLKIAENSNTSDLSGFPDV